MIRPRVRVLKKHGLVWTLDVPVYRFPMTPHAWVRPRHVNVTNPYFVMMACLIRKPRSAPQVVQARVIVSILALATKTNALRYNPTASPVITMTTVLRGIVPMGSVAMGLPVIVAVRPWIVRRRTQQPRCVLLRRHAKAHVVMLRALMPSVKPSRHRMIPLVCQRQSLKIAVVTQMPNAMVWPSRHRPVARWHATTT